MRLPFPAVLGLVACAALADQGDVLLQAKTALREGRAVAAYALLAPHEAEMGGQAEFDYLLGIAALDADHADAAVFALERAAALLPGAAYIHADLARAYGALGEMDAARQEVALAQQAGPPPAVAALLDRFLDGLAPADRARRSSVSGHLEVGAGFDSNANSATSERSMAIPAFGGYAFSLSDSAVKAGSPFHQESGNVALQHPLGDDTAALLRLGGGKRHYSRESRFDTYSWDIAAGLTRRLGQHQLSLSVQAATLGLDRADYRRSRGLFGQWQFHASPYAQVGAFFQDGSINYPAAPLRKAGRLVAGVFASRVLSAPSSYLVYGSFYGGRERPAQTDYPFLGQDLLGVRIGSQWPLGDRWSVVVGIGYERRNYGGIDPLFLLPRQDRQTDCLAGLDYAIDKNWSVRATLSGIDNASNLALNRFRRSEAQLGLRREF